MEPLQTVVSEPAPGSSSSAPGTFASRESSSTTENSANPANGEIVIRGIKKKPIPRKGHSKSRKGCYNCKRRKVKCQETLPECDHCKRIGLRCLYPPEKPPRSTTAAGFFPTSPSPTAGALSAPPPPTTTNTFTLDDMRFFQHFLLEAYPPLPIHGGGIWRSVAQISHGFDYLVHSMLGLAASSLDLHLLHSSYAPAALSHRVAAIRLLNASLSRPCSCPEEGTARYAAVMALAFQSSYMADGMLEFVAMTRGCHVVARTAMGGAFEGGPFAVFSREGHVDACRRLGPRPAWEGGNGDEEEVVLSEEAAEGLLGGLSGLARLCGGWRSKLEDEVAGKIEQVIALARWDCIEGDVSVALLVQKV